MRVYKLGIAVTAVAITVLGSGCNPDKNKLLFKPQQGAKRIVDSEVAMNFTVNLMGMKMNFGTATETTFDMTAQSVDEQGNATFDVAYKSLAYEMSGLDAIMGGGMPGAGAPGAPKMPGMPQGDDPFGMKAFKTALKTVEGQTFTVTVSKLGKVTTVTGADAIADKVAAAFKAPAAGDAMNSKKMVVAMLGDDAMKMTMQSIFTDRPDKKLNLGDTWQEKKSAGDAIIDITQDATFTVKERAGGTVSVDSVAKVDMVPQPDLLKEMGDMPGLKIEVSGQGTGTLKFDEATGWLVDGATMGQIPGNISAQVPQMGNMKIPVEVGYKVSVKTFSS